jgi:hypothetical protein
MSRKMNIERIAARAISCIVLVCVLRSFLYSQEFGFGYPDLEDYRSLGVGVAAQQFKPASGNSLADSSRIHFNTPLYLAEYRQLGLRIAFGYEPYILRGEEHTALSLEAESAYDIRITGGMYRNGVFLPVIVSTNFVEAAGDFGTAEDFNIASVGIGGGLKYRYLSDSFGVEVFGAALIHYSGLGFSTEYGTSSMYVAQLQLLFPDVIGKGVVAGYRFQQQRWLMTDADFDYMRMYQGPYIGIFF